MWTEHYPPDNGQTISIGYLYATQWFDWEKNKHWLKIIVAAPTTSRKEDKEQSWLQHFAQL